MTLLPSPGPFSLAGVSGAKEGLAWVVQAWSREAYLLSYARMENRAIAHVRESSVLAHADAPELALPSEGSSGSPSV